MPPRVRIWATLLDDEQYLRLVRTIYRILETEG
jgi:hypothetical protein